MDFYSNWKLRCLIEVLKKDGKLNEVEAKACILYRSFVNLYNKDPDYLEESARNTAFVFGKLLTSKVLNQLLYRPGFSDKIKRKVHHLENFSQKASFCYLVRKLGEKKH